MKNVASLLQARMLVLLLLTALLSSCTCTQRLNIEAKIPPTFQLKGNAVFDWCEVIDITSNRIEPNEPKSIWKLAPNGTPLKLDELAPITYGQVPAGLAQAIPQDGRPPELVEEHRYQFRVIIRTPDSKQLDQVFVIRDGKVEVIEGQDKYSSSCLAD